MRTFSFGAVSGLLIFLRLAFAPGLSASADFATDIRFDQNLNAALPLDAPFVDDAGRPALLGRYFGKKPVILAPVYYNCPSLCAMTLNGLLRTLRVMKFAPGKEFSVVAFSINPFEQPDLARSKKESYLKAYGGSLENRRKSRSSLSADPEGRTDGWHFLTGGEESIERLTTAIGFRFVPDNKNNQYAHAAGLVIVTPDGRVSRYFFGFEYSAKDLQLALSEASSNRIGSVVDRVLFHCYQYDPATGAYSLLILRMVRLAGLLTALFLGGGILYAVRREKTRAPPAPLPL